MNERLRELAKEAIANVRFWNAEKETYDVSHDELEKYAKLIVRECCKEITQEPFNAGAASLWLKDYFGVEE